VSLRVLQYSLEGLQIAVDISDDEVFHGK